MMGQEQDRTLIFNNRCNRSFHITTYVLLDTIEESRQNMCLLNIICA